MGKSISSIYSNAFGVSSNDGSSSSNDSGIDKMNIKSVEVLSVTPPFCDDNGFGWRWYPDESVTLTVPKGSVDQYKNANVWRKFVNIVEK